MSTPNEQEIPRADHNWHALYRNVLADNTTLRARLAEVEHERDVALVNEREMASALRKQQDNYNHLTSKIDSWRECINAAQNRERAALAERDGADGACQKLKDTCEVLTQEIDRLTKDRDNWKAKHWKAHDDFHRQFLEMENLRQQVASATADVSILRSEKLQLEDARRGDFRCIVGVTASNQRMAVALSDVLNTFRDDMLAMESVVVTRERKEAWKNALDSWNQYKLTHPVVSLRGMDAQANCRDEAGHYEEPK